MSGPVRRFPPWKGGMSSDPYWIAFPELKDRRGREIGMTISLRDIQKWTGMSHSMLWTITQPPSTRRQDITTENMRKIAEAFEVAPEYFLEYRQRVAIEAAADAIAKGAGLDDVLKSLRQLGGE